MNILLYLAILVSLSTCTAQKGESRFDYRHRPSTLSDASAPAVIMLHGYGSNADDLFGLRAHIPAGYHVFSLGAPVKMENGGFGWYRLDFSKERELRYDYAEAEKARKYVREFISEAIARHNIDPSRIVLLGFSQGAILSLDIAAAEPGIPAAVVAISGGMMPESRKAVKEDSKLDDVKFFIGHCSDDEVVPFSYAREAEGFLKSRKADVTFREYNGGHFIPAEELSDIDSWLTELLVTKK